MVEATGVTQAAQSNVTMCIIDSGYASTHPDLQTTNVTYSYDAGTGLALPSPTEPKSLT